MLVKGTDLAGLAGNEKSSAPGFLDAGGFGSTLFQGGVNLAQGYFGQEQAKAQVSIAEQQRAIAELNARAAEAQREASATRQVQAVDKKLPTWGWFALGGAALAATATVVLVGTRKKRRK